MEALQQTTQKQTAAPVTTPTPAVQAAPRTNRGFSPFGQDRKFGAGSKTGSNSRYGGGQRRGGYGKRDDRGPKDDMDSKLLDLSRVSHTRAGGRRLRFRAIVVSGNKMGKVGLGVASGLDVAQAVEKATIQSKKNMTFVPVVNGTITHETIAKVGPAEVMIKPQRKGRGLMAGGVVRLICQLAGIKDISSKMLGTTKNKLNNARATIKAFEFLKAQSLKNPEAVAVEAKAKEAAPVQK